MKSVIKYYTKQKSSVYTCFLDAAKAFDRVSHWTLFSKLIKRNIPLVIVRIIAFWYQTQPMCIKWGKNSSTYFNVLNGVRQGGVLSPKIRGSNYDSLFARTVAFPVQVAYWTKEVIAPCGYSVPCQF